MEFVRSGLNELSIVEECEGKPIRMGRKRHMNMMDGEEPVFKSKNLQAERKRRQKLSDRLLALRALVPIITNMNKGTIVEDAITYIGKLQNEVKVLSEQLLAMEAQLISQEAAAESNLTTKEETHDHAAGEDMKKWGIQTDVTVTSIDGNNNKLWIKMVFEKKRGSFTRLMEAMSSLGFELTDTSVTTSKGAILVSSCLLGAFGENFGAQQTRDLLLEIIRDI